MIWLLAVWSIVGLFVLLAVARKDEMRGSSNSKVALLVILCGPLSWAVFILGVVCVSLTQLVDLLADWVSK